MPSAQNISFHLLRLFLVLIVLVYPSPVSSRCTSDVESLSKETSEEAIKYKLGSIASILAAGALGVSLPLIGTKIPALRPESDIFFMVKAFAAGVILCTGFVHILPDAFDSLNSPCLEKQPPWSNFPFAGFVCMMSAIVTLMIDTFASGYYEKQHFNKTKEVIGEMEVDEEHAGHVHVHTHATHGHAHGSAVDGDDLGTADLVRRRIVSQVLEVGIVVHSVIIGISLGASRSPETIKPLLAALSFHQFFEGLGLGGCISQAQFKWRSTAMMAAFFSLTAPAGIGIGIGISRAYNEESREAVIVEGVLESASAGILIYMALVDLLAADFMNPRLQSNLRLQLGVHLSLLLGAASMSLLAKWA